MKEVASSHKMPKTRRALVEYLSRSISAFQDSPDQFRVLYTLPWSQDANGSTNVISDVDIKAPKSNALGGSGTRLKRLVVLDSSFNPPTRAHAAMLRSALETTSSAPLQKDVQTRVMLLLAIKNADKAAQPAAFPLRLGMMAGFGHEIRDWEECREMTVDIAVTTQPYFHDKAEAIRSSGFYGQEQQPEQVFLAGFDTLIRIFNPKYYAEGGGMQAALEPFFETSTMRVTLRADDEWGSAEEQRAWVKRLEGDGEEGLEARGGKKDWLKRIELVDGVDGEAVSSSRVREAVRLGRPVEGMIGDEVRAWIEEEGLYLGS